MTLLSRWLSDRRAVWELLRRYGLRPVGGGAAGHVQVAPDSTGKDVDADSLTSTEGGTPTVYRQNVVLADPITYAAKAGVANAAPVGTEYGGLVRQVPADITANSVSITVAGNGNSFAVTGYPGVAVNITGSAATFVFKAQLSTDGGTTWTDTYLQTVAGTTGSSWGANGQYSIILASGASHVRIVLSSIVSGTFTYQYRASVASDEDPVFANPPGTAVPPLVAVVGGSDGSNTQVLRATNTTPAGTEYGLITRPGSPTADRSTISQSLSMAATTNAVAINTQGCGSVSLKARLTGGVTGTANIEGTIDGSIWETISGYDLVGGNSRNQVFGGFDYVVLLNSASWAQIRLRCTATGSGSAIVSFEASTASSSLLPNPSAQFSPQDGASTAPGAGAMENSYTYGLRPDASAMDRLRTAGLSGTLGQGVLQTQPMTNSAASWPTYSASKAGGVGVASATDVATIAGSGTKTIYVTRFIFDATIATTAVLATVQLIKRSTADSGGTSSTTTAVPHDANSAAASNVNSCLFYTGNPTLGTVIANVRTWRYLFLISAATAVPAVIDHTFANPIVLRGTAQQLSCNLSGQGANATTIDVTFEWYEV